MKTLIRHIACDEPIYVVDREMKPGEPVLANEWRPLDAAWPEPVTGELMLCPNCGAGIHPHPDSLQALIVENF